MNSVLVTGATSPIGELLIRNLLADTRVEHVLAIGPEPESRALPFSHEGRLTYQSVDLSRSRRVRQLLFGIARDLNISTIVHLAQSMVAHADGKNIHALNVEALRSLLDLGDRHPTINRLVLRSFSEVYRVSLSLPTLIIEDHPLNMSGSAPQYIRDRVEADLTACTRMGLSDLKIVVLRCAEALGPGTGSQLFDYLNSSVALRPFGFNPMINVATIRDIVQALELATFGDSEGVFNIPGYDTLPLSAAIRGFNVVDVPLPETIVRPLYKIRHILRGSNFRYGLNSKRMHYGVILDGTRAKKILNYQPNHPVRWHQQ